MDSGANLEGALYFRFSAIGNHDDSSGETDIPWKTFTKQLDLAWAAANLEGAVLSFELLGDYRRPGGT